MNNNDYELLFAVVPEYIVSAIKSLNKSDKLIEFVMDLGRIPEARFDDGISVLGDKPVTQEDINYVTDRIGVFGDDNRAGIEKTLHRISAIRNRTGKIIGLTLRVGRAVSGTVDIISDLIEEGTGILLMGPPGVGKTTMLREIARVLAEKKRVVIVDTSNEIAGDGDIPHHGIGRARRMQVPHTDKQYAIMIEAVENHMPEVVVIDEIGVLEETFAARTISERGVQLVATAHGNTLENLIQNPTLSELAGGIQPVTLSDEEAKKRGCQKTILERKAPPTFGMLIEIRNRNHFVIHKNLAESVDLLLRNMNPPVEERIKDENGKIQINQINLVSHDENENSEQNKVPEYIKHPSSLRGRDHISIYPYGISRNHIEYAIEHLKFSGDIVRNVEEADVILTLKSHHRRNFDKFVELQKKGIPIFVLRSNTIAQIESFISERLL